MTEAESWESCDALWHLLHLLDGRLDRRSGSAIRRFRLFGCGLYRFLGSAIETAELFADGFVGREDLNVARTASQTAILRNLLDFPDQLYEAAQAANRIADEIYELVGTEAFNPTPLLRDIFGNPFRPVVIDSVWLRWRDGTIPRLAQQMYDSRDFASMPILADALEEAGCTNGDILGHCRGPGPHVRGCWVVDAVLGKA